MWLADMVHKKLFAPTSVVPLSGHVHFSTPRYDVIRRNVCKIESLNPSFTSSGCMALTCSDGAAVNLCSFQAVSVSERLQRQIQCLSFWRSFCAQTMN